MAFNVYPMLNADDSETWSLCTHNSQYDYVHSPPTRNERIKMIDMLAAIFMLFELASAKNTRCVHKMLLTTFKIKYEARKYR